LHNHPGLIPFGQAASIPQSIIQQLFRGGSFPMWHSRSITNFRLAGLILCCLAWSLAGEARAEGDCSMEDCEQFKEWTVGRSGFASGRVVYIAETDGYYVDQPEHRLAFVFTPGQCDQPRPYLRYPMRVGKASHQAAWSGRFRVNASDWYSFTGRLLFPENRIGTGLFESFSPSLEQFFEAVKTGLTLNSVSSQNGGQAVLHEYRLDGSAQALNAAQQRCRMAPPEVLLANETLSQKAVMAQPQPQQKHPAGQVQHPEPVSRQCQDLGFLDNPIIAMEFDRLNSRLRTALGFGLDTLNIPYEFVCQDLMDGFSADGLAELLIERYQPLDELPQERFAPAESYQPRWYDERPESYRRW